MAKGLRYFERRYFDQQDFWELSLDGDRFTVRQGTIGTPGRSSIKRFKGAEEAKRAANDAMLRKRDACFVFLPEGPQSAAMALQSDLQQLADAVEAESDTVRKGAAVDLLRAAFLWRIDEDGGRSSRRLHRAINDLTPLALCQEARVLGQALTHPKTEGRVIDLYGYQWDYRLGDTWRRDLGRAADLPDKARAALLKEVGKGVMTDGGYRKSVARLLAAGARWQTELSEMVSDAPSLAGVHSLLVAGLRAASVQTWPRTFHRGELRPNIGAVGYEPLARTLADWLAAAGYAQLRDKLVSSAEREKVLRRPDLVGASLRPTIAKVVEALCAKGAE
jgi:predicted DNA-binding WGR domain protein